VIRTCQKCNRVTGQRKCVYCGHGTPGSNIPREQTAVKVTPTRQTRRAALFAQEWDARKVPPTSIGPHPRKERRKLARAFAAGVWRKARRATV
jgi:hypothetical protein